MAKIIISFDDHVLTNSIEFSKTAYNKRLYKIYSLIISNQYRINIPDTLFIFQNNKTVFNTYCNDWLQPLIIRVDYTNKPKNKILGGVPIYNDEIRNISNNYLKSIGYFVMYHPYIDRFANLYSVGVLFNLNNDQITIEVVGSRFNASDIRLGKSIPHEIIIYNLNTKTVNKRSVIDQNTYLNERAERSERIAKFNEYIKYVNMTGKFKTSLEDFCIKNNNIEFRIPISYTVIPDNIFRELIIICNKIKFSVLKHLPISNSYAASLSYIDNSGWVLWDIYGDWYNR
jgi:hypothetical protein